MFKKNKFVIIAGPCAIESRNQLFQVAEEIKKAGIKVLRGGAYKPRTSPYTFQGLEKKGLKILSEAGKEFGLKTITEVTDSEYIPSIIEHVDILQVGTRNMDNYALLKKIGKKTATNKKWVLIKRGYASTIEEWLLAAEYIISANNQNVVLCERGIRTFEKATRFTLDLSAVPVVKKLSSYPVIVDISHAAGHSDLINPLSKAAVAVGADGIMIEVHPNPKKALCDGAQSLDFSQLHKIVKELKPFLDAAGKEML